MSLRLKYQFLIFFFSLSCMGATHTPPTDAQIAEAQSSFKYKGQWIHPALIKDFLPWVSDHTVPIIHALDIAAAEGTNRYADSMNVSAGQVSYTTGDQEIVAYEWKGKLKNGLHVLILTERGSGTMVATNIAVFKITKLPSIDESGKPYNKLLLENVRMITGGDRANVTLSLKENILGIDVKCSKTCDSKKINLQF